ncbi:TetR/AcrR family transcriptional regulator [Citricoccus sp. K5]|uniref:TetR/AcrR family transcriptional regulator n=1 Tax=Citricoccus sp. K5 TaxID=2653135 RepID=UPI00191655CE
MDRVASEAEVAIVTLYKHFGSKDNLLREVLSRRLTAWTQHWDQAISAAEIPRIRSPMHGTRRGCSSTRVPTRPHRHGVELKPPVTPLPSLLTGGIMTIPGRIARITTHWYRPPGPCSCPSNSRTSASPCGTWRPRSPSSPTWD